MHDHLIRRLRMAGKLARHPILARTIAQAVDALQRVPDDPFKQWREPRDPPDILPEILAARCLGLSYGDPGPVLPPEWCRACWGDRHVWYGNAWGLRHVGEGLQSCEHACHEGQVWMA